VGVVTKHLKLVVVVYPKHRIQVCFSLIRLV